jgi:hypothetical protein
MQLGVILFCTLANPFLLRDEMKRQRRDMRQEVEMINARIANSVANSLAEDKMLETSA